ncbi:MAG TPA: ATP-binding protein [Candidatus Acidoferrales bacterium]|nr:ATP-binding protein [Candidatus Acidoferrales bacterium]
MKKVPGLVWATDSDLQFTSLTGATLARLGIHGEDYLHRPITDLFSEIATVPHRDALRGVGHKLNLNFRNHELDVTLEPVREQGVIIGVIGVALDATERRFAERALRISEQSYRSLVEGSPYGVCRATPTGQLLQVNSSLLRMLEYKPEQESELLMLDLPQIFDSAESFEQFYRRLLLDGLVHGAECVWRRSDGYPIHVRLAGNVVRNHEGHVVYVDLFAENVTPVKRLEDQLRHAQKIQALGQLAGGVAHDFNNLLTIISGQLELLQGDTQEDLVLGRVEEIRAATERAAALTRQLLAFSRRQVLQNRVIDVNQLISQLCRMLSRLLREDIELIISLEAEPSAVRADFNQLEQVLMNLAVNARDAMPSGGKLTISTANKTFDQRDAVLDLAPGEYILICVQDTGLGMTPETRERIFDPFFTTKPPGSGVGLGLSMVLGVVEQSGGKVDVDSTPGAGSRFSIYLPRDDGKTTATEKRRLEEMPGGLETILLAEDEASLRELLNVQLRNLGYKVIAAVDGQDALEIAQTQLSSIDLLITDMVMPRLGGRDLANALRSGKPELNVIFISGYPGNENTDMNADFAAGAHFLAKPFSLRELAQLIRVALKRR